MCQLLTLLVLYTQKQNDTVGSTTFKGRVNWKIVQALVEVLKRMHKKRWMGKCTEKVVKSD